MGSVTGVVDAGANVTRTANWDAFGEVRSGDVSSAVAGGGFGLHGMWLDDSTGLYYVRARTYDATTGRFLSRDPVAGVTGRPETMNPYAFTLGAPLVWADPTGEFSIGEAMATVATIFVVSNISGPAFAQFKQAAKLTALKVNVIRFSNSGTSIANLHRELRGARSIWLRAGIDLHMRILTVSQADLNRLAPGGTVDPPSYGVPEYPGGPENDRIYNHWKSAGGIGAIFADTVSHADPHRRQATIGSLDSTYQLSDEPDDGFFNFNSIYNYDAGRTLAHEIGHLLLHGGPCGGGSGCGSSLMGHANFRRGTGISQRAAAVARKRAAAIMGI